MLHPGQVLRGSLPLLSPVSVITGSKNKIQGTKATEHYAAIYSGVDRHVRGQLGVMIWIHIHGFYSQYRDADKSLARPTSRCILFDGENISFDASLVIFINSTNIPPIMIIKRIYETQNLLSL